MDKSLLQEEVDQGGLIALVPQLSQAFEDASDAQVVVSVPVNKGERLGKADYWLSCFCCVERNCSHVEVRKSLGPVQRPLDHSCFLTLELDPIEVQHQYV